MSQQPYIRQVFAGPMANCLYVLGDPSTMKAVIIDPAFEPVGLLGIAEAEGYTVEAVLATHVHPDHVGGQIMGFDIPGVRELFAERPLPIHIHEAEVERLQVQTGTASDAIRPYREGDTLEIGNLRVSVYHTPGHSPGSSCFHVGSHLISGDTLFVEGCGRIDLPGSNTAAMFHSLQRLKALAPETTIYPGHNYGSTPTSTIGRERERNVYLRVDSLERWRTMMGG